VNAAVRIHGVAALAGVIIGAILASGCGGSEGRSGGGGEPDAPAKTTAVSATAPESRSADGTYAARWEPRDGTIPDAEPFAARFAVRRTDGRPIAESARFIVDAEMPQHGHGMNLVPTVERLRGDVGGGEIVLVANGMLFHMPGRWVLSLDVIEDGVLERAQWYVDVE
jgi:hypothetical protein